MITSVNELEPKDTLLFTKLDLKFNYNFWIQTLTRSKSLNLHSELGSKIARTKFEFDSKTRIDCAKKFH